MPRGGRVYRTGGREPSIVPGTLLKTILKWEMPPGLFGHSYEENQNGECGDDAAPVVTATLGVQLGLLADGSRFPDGVHVDWSDAFVQVSYGSSSGCNDAQTVDVDLMDGTALGLVARDATFAVSYPTPQSPDPAGLVQPIIDVSISIGIGSLGSGAGVRSARRTVKIGNIGNQGAGGTSGVLPIPRYAHSAIFSSADNLTTATMNQLRAPIAGSDNLSIVALGKQEGNAVPIYPGARGFTLTTATQATTAAVIFLLAPA
jgi:hypothetical protein